MIRKGDKELLALINLLDDPDRQVYDSVSNRLIELGDTVIQPLETRWESTLKPELQQRIEQIIRKIQYGSLQRGMENWRSEGGSELLRGAYLVARFHYPELELDLLEEKFERIRKDIWLELNNELTALEKVKVINYFLYDIYKFDKSLKKAHTPHLYLINHVLDTTKGSPVMLGLIYAELARRLELPIYGVNLPRNFVLCYYDDEIGGESDGILFYINPSDKGAVLGKKELQHFLKTLKIDEKPFYFTPCSNIDVIERLLINLQFAYDKSGQTEKAEALRSLLRKDQT